MFAVLLMGMAGIALGLLLARASVPHISRPLAACASVLALLVALALVLSDATNFGAALTFLVALLFASAALAAARWKAYLPGRREGYGWFFWVTATRPGYLRSMYAAAGADRGDSKAAP